MSKRKITVVTGSRAEYGLLYWTMKTIQADPALELQVVVTGMHLEEVFGSTYRTIEQDGFTIQEKVPALVQGDTAIATAKSIARGTAGFADALDRLTPDIILLLGDRFEILACAQAALVANIPIAHIHGGEVTEGAFDDAIRHSITKMSHLHFVATDAYRKRVIQLGEQPNSVFTVGAPGLECIRKTQLLDRTQLEQELNFTLGEQLFLVTYHPETLGKQSPTDSLKVLFGALDDFPDTQVIITYPNADTGGAALIKVIEQFAQEQPKRVLATPSLGQLKYLSAMRHADVVIGNSSSGIIEAPSLHKPTVNIGNRQKGRMAADSVIHCPESTEDIKQAIRQALSAEFRKAVAGVKNPYGAGESASKIVNVIKQAKLEGMTVKQFYDLP